MLPDNVKVEQSLVDTAIEYLNEREVPIFSNVQYFNEDEDVDRIRIEGNACFGICNLPMHLLIYIDASTDDCYT